MSARTPLQERAERLQGSLFLGGPTRDFERVGSLSFQLLLKEGLQPSSRVLDVGCGALRVGYWLMRFLDPGCYFGIEPQRDVVRRALSELLEPEVLERSDARFSYNEDFDFTVFGETFDFVIARSVWTHACKRQISAMLRSFSLTSAPGGVFLASYMPASFVAKAGRRWSPAERVAPRLSCGYLPTVVRGLPRRSVGGRGSPELQGRDRDPSPSLDSTRG
jgi:SAM-dependent methyltransferase